VQQSKEREREREGVRERTQARQAKGDKHRSEFQAQKTIAPRRKGGSSMSGTKLASLRVHVIPKVFAQWAGWFPRRRGRCLDLRCMLVGP